MAVLLLAALGLGGLRLLQARQTRAAVSAAEEHYTARKTAGKRRRS